MIQSEPAADQPIFVRGLSRSGGTLMVTILDAHPDVAMSYELYPTLLEPAAAEKAPREILRGLLKAKPTASVRKLANARGWQTFLGRCARGGLTFGDVGNLLEQHLDAGEGFEAVGERLRFIERCCLLKMQRYGKKTWGLKCNNRYSDYLDQWPEARFVNMIRDGRDVLASQLSTGAFNKDPAGLAMSWLNTHRSFLALREQIGDRAVPVIYEHLAKHPAEETANILTRLGLCHDPGILDYHKQDLTIYRASHLSLAEVSKPVNASKVGRWMQDLTADQVAAFETVAGDLLEELGYQRASAC